MSRTTATGGSGARVEYSVGMAARDDSMDVTTWMDGPQGSLRLVANAGGLREIQFAAAEIRGPSPLPTDCAPAVARLLKEATAQLRAYFKGTLHTFDLPLDPQGTPFQLKVWAALRQIPYAQTVTYGALARALGRPGAARAVGSANHRNPLAILVPCHRVIGASGALVGYAGGLAWKAWLLRHEQTCSSRPLLA